MSRHRCYCFTLNNPTPSDAFGLQLLWKKSQYYICGREVGDVKETYHLQGYVRFKNPQSFDFVKKHIPRAHIEVARGSDEDNKRYCSKQGDYDESGTISVGQGHRADISEVTDLIRSGSTTIEEIMFDYPELYVRYYRAFERMFSTLCQPRSRPPEVYWRWGLAGTGKTRWVIDKHGPNNVYIKDNTSWWDGYNQQDVILIDDFDNQIPYRTLLRILDRYAYQGQVKGGYVQINSPYIFITCEFHPTHYWSGNELDQVTRRLSGITEVRSTSVHSRKKNTLVNI